MELIDARSVRVRVAAEGDVQVLEELVAAREQALWRVSSSIHGRLPIEYDDSICEIRGHDEVVLDDEGSLLSVHDETLDYSSCDDTLLGVEVGAGLVNQVDIGGHAECQDDGNTLQFSTGEILHFLVDEVVHLEGLVNIRLELWAQESSLDLFEEQLSDRALKSWCDFLGLHANVHCRNFLGAIRLLCTSKHFAESSLASTVLAHHDDYFGVGKLASFNRKMETAQGLLHLRVTVST